MKTLLIISLFLLCSIAKSDVLSTGCISNDRTDKMTACWSKRLEQEDKLLQTVFDNYIRDLKAAEKTQRAVILTVAQRSWMRFRDNDCKFDYSVGDAGDQAGVAEEICLIRETTNRRLQLEQSHNHFMTNSVIPR